MKTVLQSLKHHSEYPRQNNIALKNFSENVLENVMLLSNLFRLQDIFAYAFEICSRFNTKIYFD